MTEQIFLLQGEALTALPIRPYREGFDGERLERALHGLLERYPSLLPGAQIDPSAEEPPRFAVLASEVPIGSWSLDLLMTDQFGVPTLIETKLSENPEARRAVIGQIIEYAASSHEALANGGARACAEKYWARRDAPLDLARVFGEAFDVDELWRRFERNLEDRRLRLVIGADHIRPEVRRMIEYLNNEMENAEVLGLELKAYADSDSRRVIVPQVIGQTLRAAERKSGEERIDWTLERLKDAFGASESAQVRENFLAVLEWASTNERLGLGRRSRPGFYVLSSKGVPIASLREPEIYIHMVGDRYRGGNHQLRTSVDAMKTMGLFDSSLDPDTVVDGRTAKRRLQDLGADDIHRLIQIWAAA